jgi:Tripartite tricarboxylate transporter TctB family
MKLKIKNPQDFGCGLLFLALGAAAIYLSRDYEIGSALHMGPGYFPTGLGIILIGFGVVIGGLALRIAGDDGQSLKLSEWALRPWLVLSGSLALFALLMEADFGFVPSLILLIIGCALAHRDVHWRETLLLSVAVTAGAVAIFSYGLGMPYPLFWWSN